MSDLDRLIAWLEKQPLEFPCNFKYPDKCLIAEWRFSEGRQNYRLFSDEIIRQYGIEIYRIVRYGKTYGGTLRLARELKDAQRL